jgi:hypothetical protein
MVGHATNTDGTAAAKAADLARTEAESPFYTTKQGRAGAGHLLIDFRLHGKPWVLGGLYRSTVGFFFANENRRAKTHATTAETRRRQTHRPPPQLKSLATSRPETQVVHARNNSARPGSYPRKKGQKVPQKHPHTGCVGSLHRDDLAKEKSQRPVTTCCEERPGLVVGL